jgi:hypothetical protein
VDRFVDLEGVRAHLAPFYSPIGRPPIDPELMIRMLLVGYCLGIRSERRLCEEDLLNTPQDARYRHWCISLAARQMEESAGRLAGPGPGPLLGVA